MEVRSERRLSELSTKFVLLRDWILPEEVQKVVFNTEETHRTTTQWIVLPQTGVLMAWV